MTIRLRLTLLFAALLGGLSAVWMVALIAGLALTLDRIVEADVRNKVHVVVDYLHDLDAELTAKGQHLDLTSFDALPRAFSDDGMYLQLTNVDGGLLNRSPNLGHARLPTPHDSGVTVDVPLPGVSVDAVMAAGPLALPAKGQVAWVQAAYPPKANQRTLVTFAALAAAAWVLLVSAALVAGYFFAGRALAPVAAMTEDVRRMRAADLHRRLPVAQPPTDEIDRLGATFNELFGRLESAFEAQRRFVADASHELRSPLTAIIGNLQLIRRRGGEHPAEISGWASTAEGEAGRLARLVDGLLTLARSDEGQLTMVRQPVEVQALARGVAERFAVIAPRVAYAGGPGATTSAAGTTGAAGTGGAGGTSGAAGPSGPGEADEAWVDGDADRLTQVLINLVDNAVRATRDGGQVTLEAVRVGPRVKLIVRDTGVGMAPEVAAKVFDRFFRADAGRGRVDGGAGLGLAIVAAIVEDHAGHVGVESRAGHGTAFTVDLPARLPDA